VHELQEIGEARLLGAEARLGPAEMVEHHRDARRGDDVLDRRDHRQRDVHLHVPAARLHALHGIVKALARHDRVGLGGAGGEVDADAADAGALHGVEIRLGRLLVDHGDAARVAAACLHAHERGRVVRAIHARRHDHHALHAERAVQLGHLRG